MPATFLNELLILIVAAFLGGFVARSLMLPPILGYITSGIVFGAISGNFFTSYTSLLHLSELGVSLLLFTLGFEISFDKLKKINKKIFLLGLLQISLTSFVLMPLLLIFNIEFKTAILFSILFSFSSTAVVVKILEEKGLLSDFPGSSVFIFLLIQDIFIMPIVFFLPILFTSSQAPLVSDFSNFFLSLIKTIGIFAGILMASKFFLPKITSILFRYPSHELNILATIFIAALSIGMFTAVGVPQSIAAFLAGVLISEEGKNLTPLSEIRPIRDILLVLFFVLTGMLLNVQFVTAHLIQILSIAICVLLIKFAVIFFLLKKSNYITNAAVFIASYLTNIGEFAVVIAQFSFISNYISKDNYNILLSVFIFSLILFPIWVESFKKMSGRISKIKFLGKAFRDVSLNLPYNFQTESYLNHVVICGHGRVGKQVRGLLELANIPYIVIDFNKKIIEELFAKNRLAIYGDPTDEDILKSAFIEKARVLVVAVPDRQSQKKIIKEALFLNPKIIVLCRSHEIDDRYELINLGVNAIIIPEFEAGIKIGSEVLQIFSVPPETINYNVKKIRREHLL